MAMRKKYFSYSIYILSIIILLGSGLELILSFKEFIFSGKGIGVYGVLIFYVLSFVSVILWSISFWLVRNKKLAIVFWLCFLIITAFISIQPTWWAAPSLSS